MKKDSCSINIVLDKSGSMQSLTSDTIGGFNRFIEEQSKVPGECRVSTILFDTQVLVLHENEDIKNVKPLTTSQYRAGGSTALLDAIALTIQKSGKRYADMPEDQRPDKVIVVIMTDGEENSSGEFGGPAGHARVMGMIKHQEEAYKWDFIFIGAQQDAIQSGSAIGVRAVNSMSMGATGQAVSDTYKSLSDNVALYRSSGRKSSLSFSKKQRDEQREQGAHPDSMNQP